VSEERRPNNPPQRVDRTGIALVHRGDWIFPEEDALAELTTGGERVVNYYFPVEIEIVGEGAADALVERVCDELRKAIESLG
jgi:hypothetical protein